MFFVFRDPNRLNDEVIRDIRWRPMLPNRFNYLDMGDEYQMRDKLYLERYTIWNDLFPLPARRRGKDNETTLDIEYEKLNDV